MSDMNGLKYRDELIQGLLEGIKMLEQYLVPTQSPTQSGGHRRSS